MSNMQVRPAPVLGVYDVPLWEYAKSNEFRLQRCSNCAEVRYPPGLNCPKCLGEDYEWALMSGHGRVASSCVFHRQYFPEIPVPLVVVMVEIDEGPIVVGNLVDAKAGQPRLKQPVEIVFEPVVWTDGREGKIFQWRAIA